MHIIHRVFHTGLHTGGQRLAARMTKFVTPANADLHLYYHHEFNLHNDKMPDCLAPMQFLPCPLLTVHLF